MRFLGVYRKLTLSKIGVMDMSYIMDSGQNGLYTTFHNIFALISADPADLSHIEKNHFFLKKSRTPDRCRGDREPRRRGRGRCRGQVSDRDLYFHERK